MTNYLTFKKIILDSVALYRAHFLYLTVLIGAVMVPYYFLGNMESLGSFVDIIVILYILAKTLVELVAIRLVSTGYIEGEFNISTELKGGFKAIFPYLFISLMGIAALLSGLLLLIIPSYISVIFFNILKVDYALNGGKIRDRFISSFKQLKGGIFIKLVKIYAIPALLLLAFAFLIQPYISLETFEEDIYPFYPYITAGSIILFPLSISFKTAIYFNIIKEKQLETTD